MNDFIFYNPARIIFGCKSGDSLTEMLDQRGVSNVLLLYGEGFIKKSGIYDKVLLNLETSSVQIFELGGVKPNSRLSLVYKGIELCRKHNIDFVLAVGGGRVIDSAKAIAAGVKYSGDIWECFTIPKRITAALPLGVILTIPAAGSETSSGMVITNEDTG